jgi:hypothetical protein
MQGFPFALDPGDRLELRARLADGVVFGAVAGAARHDARLAPALTVAWLAEPPSVTLGEVVAEDLARALSVAGSALIDREDVTLGGRPAVRTSALHRGPGGLPSASEQWRLLAGGRRWTVTAMTALVDQPEWGPALARVAESLRVRS